MSSTVRVPFPATMARGPGRPRKYPRPFDPDAQPHRIVDVADMCTLTQFAGWAGKTVEVMRVYRYRSKLPFPKPIFKYESAVVYSFTELVDWYDKEKGGVRWIEVSDDE